MPIRAQGRNHNNRALVWHNCSESDAGQASLRVLHGIFSFLPAGTFPFGDPDDANGKNGVQTMIARIMKVDITPLPEALSTELKELLDCILIADPTKRPNIQQVTFTEA